ncbi:uncharacterized protein [Diabrotica undecimpunctata]|uniref:uncharacterized protein n=1 Tax=Diabrotica undecimpunctata TaxID=50387 RepID=UPI003B631D00
MDRNSCLFSGSYFDTSTLAQQDTPNSSWSNISCNWSKFSPGQEIACRNEYVENCIKEINCPDIPNGNGGTNQDLKNKLKDLHQEYIQPFQENVSIATQQKADVKILKNLKNTYTNLTSQYKNLLNLKDNLEKDEKETLADYTLKKESFQKAIHMYTTYFDLNISIEDSSDAAIVASVCFASVKTMTPVKVIIDRKEKKIIDVDSNGLLTKEECEVITFGPEFLYYLRQRVLNPM